MDYKEKYEQALERAKNYHEGHTLDVNPQAAMEYVFPELQESEEERIRKEIIQFLQLPHPQFVGKRNHEEWIAWLEKQGEQKSVDKVEPKFKVGDWITIDNPCQIISIDGNYIVQYCDDETTREISKKFCESQFHTWTIQDAKDGDVLCDYSEEYNTPLIFILKKFEHVNFGLVKLSDYSSYCFLTAGDRQKFKEGSYHHKCNIKPATKEQRELLFSKMKEAGYEWDADKKELKKIKQTYFQKQEWTGYDEKAYEIALLDIDKSPSITKNDSINWLKSLKERYTWKPSDAHMQALEKVRVLLHSPNIWDESNPILYQYEELMRDLIKLREE